MKAAFLWYHQESNQGHKDFQSFALPTELWHPLLNCGAKLYKDFNYKREILNII